MRFSLISVLAVLTVFMAILPIWWLWTTGPEGKVASWLKLMIATSWFAFAFLAAPWVLVSLYLRMAFLALFVAAAFRFVRSARRRSHAYPTLALREPQTLLPRQLDAYEIFGDAVYNPCDGSVRQARDGVADNTPGEVNQQRGCESPPSVRQ